MKFHSIKRAMSKTAGANFFASAMVLALLGASNLALAAGGNVSGVSVTPNTGFAGDMVNLKVNVTQGSFGTDCRMHWAVRDAANIEVKGASHKMQSDANTADYSTGFALPAPGVYTVEATGGAPDSQTISCGGKAATTLTVKDKFAVNANPGLVLMPAAAPRPANAPVVQLPAAVLQVTALTSIKQVPNTGNSGETWIEVQGTGNCSFTIESAGVPTAGFSSSAARPFPMKVKIQGAPLGSHQWKAKGTGNCTGSANATFSVS
jgi:hypothetical protein